MADWSEITIPDFDALVADHDPADSVSLGVLDRLPFTFESKKQYVQWRDSLAAGWGIDGKDVALVGSAASGRSLSARKQFKTFRSNSDIDIAAVSTYHFDIAWRWFRTTDPNLVTGLDSDTMEKFHAHRKHYIFEGVVAADYFLSHLPFGNEWVLAMQRSQKLLPRKLQGRLMKVRIYKDYLALREAQTKAMNDYKRYLTNKLENQADSNGE